MAETATPESDELLAEVEALVQARIPRRFSVTLLSQASQCLLSAKFSRIDGFDASGEPAVFGSIVHEILATLDFIAQTSGRRHIPEAEAQIIADRVLMAAEEATGPLDPEGYFALMEMVGTWAVSTEFPDTPDGWQVELPVETELEGFKLSGRIDKLVIEGKHGKITDYKTGGYLPDAKEMAKRMQLPLYAWHCSKIYPWVESWECEEQYLRRRATRTVHVTRDDLEKLEQYLRIAVHRVEAAFAKGEPEPTPGSWCAICPAPEHCPLTQEAAPERITSEEQAVAIAGQMLAVAAHRNKLSKSLQAYCKQDGHRGFVIAGDKQVGYLPKTKRQQNKRALGNVVVNLDDFYEQVETVEWGTKNVK